ncbi:MAG: ISNCY family transposase [Candidatus Thermoplasmatota archaeon]|jgi:transposase|nr:ISNCY family transposase [Candidatus Thermoplasmatota archaeon]
MRITERMAQDLIEVLDAVKEECFHKEHSVYPFAAWEHQRERVKQRLRDLPSYVDRAANLIHCMTLKAGRPKHLDLSKRTMLFLFTRLLNKSNRDIEELLVLFEPLFGFQVSYKSIERLYSDPEVRLALHNLFILLLQNEGVSGDYAGDGTGYTLTVTRHYRTATAKHGHDFLFVFRIIDIDTGLYVAFGYSNSSEMEAFHKAMDMLRRSGMPIDSMALDKYYSSRKVLALFDKETTLYLIPKKNLRRAGMEWSRILRQAAEDPYGFLKGYYLRNLSESGFSTDKRRFGGLIRQRREDRRESAVFSTTLLHNLFIARVRPG